MVRQSMTRRVMIPLIALMWGYPVSGLTEPSICGPQNYDSEDPPDFDCPGPEEGTMVPRLRPPGSVPVRQGSEVVAQWDGALVHRDRLLEVGLRVTGLRRLRWADRLRLGSVYRVELQHVRDTCDARVTHARAQRDAYQERWQAAEQRARAARSWWRSPALWVAVGVVVTGGLVALTAYGLSAIPDAAR